MTWQMRKCSSCGKDVAARQSAGEVLCTECHPEDLPFTSESAATSIPIFVPRRAAGMVPETGEDWTIPDEPLTAERAALMAATVLDNASDACHDPEHSAALVQIADGWTRLHTALAESAHAILDSIEQRPTPVTVNIEGLTVKDADLQKMSEDIEQELAAGWPRLDRKPKPEPNYSLDNRERAREWIDGFHQATEEDRVNIIALLLGAADDALAMSGKLRDATGVYRERAHLVAYLATQYPAVLAYIDPNEPDWPVIYIDTRFGQLSWHIGPDDLDLFQHVKVAGRQVPLDQAPAWDGHTTDQKYKRLTALVAHESDI